MDLHRSLIDRQMIAERCNGEAVVRSLVGRARVEGIGVWLSLLDDADVWRRQDRFVQDEVLRVVAIHLGDDYEFSGASEFSCMGLRNRLGVFVHRATEMILHLVPGGTYMMGSPDNGGHVLPEESPIHEVKIKPMLVGKYPVIGDQWDKVEVTINLCPSNRFSSCPVSQLSCLEARKWLREARSGLRLPSEAEWEYACRAGSTTRYFWGDSMKGDFCWHSYNSGYFVQDVHRHDSYANAFGLVDMLGNVREWCEDGWRGHYKDGPYDHKPMDFSKESGKDCFSGVLRGGSANNYMDCCRSASRWIEVIVARRPWNGFRAFRSIY